MAKLRHDTRECALEISDALTELGVSHSIVVGVAERCVPRESYTVNVTPMLTYSPADITALQRVADKFNLGIAYVAGSFMFTAAKR